MFRNGKRIYALGRLKTGQMNKTEAAYELKLRALKEGGMILEYWFESIKLKVADNQCWLLPDFLVMLTDGSLELHEVKGSLAIYGDDSKVKNKVVASKYPFKFKVVYPIPKKNGGGWGYLDYSSQEEEK